MYAFFFVLAFVIKIYQNKNVTAFDSLTTFNSDVSDSTMETNMEGPSQSLPRDKIHEGCE